VSSSSELASRRNKKMELKNTQMGFTLIFAVVEGYIFGFEVYSVEVLTIEMVTSLNSIVVNKVERAKASNYIAKWRIRKNDLV